LPSYMKRHSIEEETNTCADLDSYCGDRLIAS
jgi:hypothetical protein